MRTLLIAGAGPAGCAAALAALAEGAPVELRERSRAPRHKVCGEFLSPETGAWLEHLGVWNEFAAARPARISRLSLHLGTSTRSCNLPETAFGLSRYTLDELLVEAAGARGARVLRGETETHPDIDATGRTASGPRGNRLFGFKAHFRGPADDAVELYFFSGAYAGVSTVESGVTNVCALAPEPLLRAHGFDFDAVLANCAPLAERLRPLTRTMEWLAAGPLAFGLPHLAAAPYTAGDAFGFVDPFTGTGILNALVTGSMAGIAAARGIPPEQYLRASRRAVARPFEIAALLRSALGSGWAAKLAPFVPTRWLFRLTRPRAALPSGPAALFPR